MTGVIRRLDIRLEPDACRVYDVRAQLGEHVWRRLEGLVRRDAGGKCWICGGEDRVRLEPRWRYDEGRSLRILLGFELNCRLCFHGHRPGRAWAVLAAEDWELVLDNYKRINAVSEPEWSKDLDAACEVWRRRNELNWKTDLGFFAVFAGRSAWIS